MAITFLKSYFTDHTEVEAKKIQEMAKNKNIWKRTLDEAKKYIPGLGSDKKGDVWFWILNKDQISEGGSDE